MLYDDTVRHQLYSDFTAEQLALLGEGTIPVARLIINESKRARARESVLFATLGSYMYCGT